MIFPQAMSISLGVLFLLFRRDNQAASLSLCDVQRYLEVKEGQDDNTFTCTAVKEGQTFNWYLGNYGDYAIATCLPSSCTIRDERFKTIIGVSRSSTTSSAITLIETNVASPQYFFGTSNLTCEITPQEKVQCLLDYVYPADNITCTIAFNKDTWSVIGLCTISKVRSIRDNYYCFLYQQSESSQGSTSVGSYTMNINSLDTMNINSSRYYSGRCNMTSYLPSDGRYNYSVSIMPGKVNVSATFNGSNVIMSPKKMPTHNCLSYVKEGDSVNCECSISEYGSPPGKLTWNTTSSNMLSLRSVNMNQHGDRYVCSLTWNNTVLNSVTYTLLVAYPPTKMSLKLNSGEDSMTVAEKSLVNISCQSDGIPTPSMTITNGDLVLKSLPGENTTIADTGVNISHGLVETRCEDSGEYRCTASNSVGSKDLTVRLLVSCTPRRNLSDGNYSYPIIEKDDSTNFELVMYPTSVNVTKYYLGLYFNSNKEPASDGVFNVECTPSSQYLYKVTCIVRVIDVTPETAGYYEVSVSNELGSVAFVFQTLASNTTKMLLGNNSDGSLVGAIAGGVGGGVLGLSVVAIAIVCFLRRKEKKSKMRPDSPKTRKKDCQGTDNGLTINDIYEVSDTRPLASEQGVKDNSVPLSMSPVTKSVYENEDYRGEDTKNDKKGNGAGETQRRKDQGMVYTTVVFSSSASNQPTPKWEATEYAAIRQANAE